MSKSAVPRKPVFTRQAMGVKQCLVSQTVYTPTVRRSNSFAN